MGTPDHLSRADTASPIRNYIRERRIARGWSQEELGRRLGGLSKVDIHLLETGRTPASMAILAALAVVFEEPWEQFYPHVQLSWADRAPAHPVEHGAGSQSAALLDLLRRRGEAGVTPIEALDEIGSFRLGARVWDLRREGHLIVNLWHRTPAGARVARYVLREGERP